MAKRAKEYGVPVFCLSGSLGRGAVDVLAQGIDALMSICDGPLSLEDCMSRSDVLIESATARLCRIIKAAHKSRAV